MTVEQVSRHKSAYRADIDGLRAFAVLSVLVFHAFPGILSGGFIGVDVFFVISGFLITSHILEKLAQDAFSFSYFFASRIRRIFPALILVLIASLTFGSFSLLADEFIQLSKHVASSAVFVLNYSLIDESGYFDNASQTKPLLHLWSLSVEEQFYIIWPLVLWISWKQKLNLLVVTALVALASFYLNLKYVGSKPVEVFFWPTTRFWELLSGSVLAWCAVYRSARTSALRLSIDKFIARSVLVDDCYRTGFSVSNLMSFLGGALLLYGITRLQEGLAWPSALTLIPVFGVLLIISAGPKAWLSRTLLTNPIAVWVGLISYPLYLWHWPLLSFLQIIEGGLPGKSARFGALILSVVLAWITYKFFERPIRFGCLKKTISAPSISIMLFSVGYCGYFFSNSDLTYTHVYEALLFKRKGFEHATGNSLQWYQGRGDWLFLGNSVDNNVAKLKLSVLPERSQIELLREQFASMAGASLNSKVALLVGPNKSSVYPEFLPEKFASSEKRYISYFTDELATIQNLIVHDPTDTLRQLKRSEGLLYYRTDSHWNAKGAFFAYSGLLKRLDVLVPRVEFTQQPEPLKGDLIALSNVENFPAHSDDNWAYFINEQFELVEEVIPNVPNTSFGSSVVVKNSYALSEMTVWVVGDSFTAALRPYINATFQEVRYVGHADDVLEGLPADVASAAVKPDLIIVVKVERRF